MFYSPIIKQKKFECKYSHYLDKAFQNARIIPFFEIISEYGKEKPNGNKNVFGLDLLLSPLQSSKRFFVGIPRSANYKMQYKPDSWLLASAENPEIYLHETLRLLEISGNAIPCFYLHERTVEVEAINFIRHCHSRGRPCALSITNDDFWQIAGIKELKNDDFVFVNIGSNQLPTKTPLFNEIRAKAGTMQILPVRENRRQDVTNASLKDEELTDSILPDLDEDAATNGFYGFADYASLRNDSSINVKIKDLENVYPTIALFQEKDKKYLIAKSDNPLKKGIIHGIGLKQKLLNRKAKIDPFDYFRIYEIIDTDIKGKGAPGQFNVLSLVYYIYQMNERLQSE
jgi:hypothetical protein